MAFTLEVESVAQLEARAAAREGHSRRVLGDAALTDGGCGRGRGAAPRCSSADPAACAASRRARQALYPQRRAVAGELEVAAAGAPSAPSRAPRLPSRPCRRSRARRAPGRRTAARARRRRRPPRTRIATGYSMPVRGERHARSGAKRDVVGRERALRAVARRARAARPTRMPPRASRMRNAISAPPSSKLMPDPVPAARARREVFARPFVIEPRDARHVARALPSTASVPLTASCGRL